MNLSLGGYSIKQYSGVNQVRLRFGAVCQSVSVFMLHILYVTYPQHKVSVKPISKKVKSVILEKEPGIDCCFICNGLSKKKQNIKTCPLLGFSNRCYIAR